MNNDIRRTVKELQAKINELADSLSSDLPISSRALLNYALPRPIERVAYGIAEAAEAMGISASTFRQLMEERNLKTLRVGTRVLIPKDALRAMVEDMLAEQLEETGGATSDEYVT